MSDLAAGFHSLPLEFQNVVRLAQDRLTIVVTPLQALTGGWSGASLYLVSVASPDPERVEHLILKLDRKSEKSKSDEIERHQAAVSHSPADFASRHMAHMAFDRVEQDGVMAMFYAIAGQSLNHYRPLSFYEKQSQVEAIFAETYQNLLNHWNSARTFKPAVHPQAVLEQWLSFRLKPGNQIESFLETVCRLPSDVPGFLIQGGVFPNPLAYARHPEWWGAARPIDVLVGLQHGDLNTNNILVKLARNDQALDGYYLIDFALFKAAMPLLYDVRYLEMSYLVLRQSQVSFSRLADLVARLGESDALDPLEVPIDVVGLGALVVSARRVFEQWVKDNHPSLHDDLWGQYWLAGVAAGLSYSHKPGLATEARLAGLLYAAANLKRYAALFGVPTPAEGRQLYDAAQVHRTQSFVSSVAGRPAHNLPAQSTTFIGRESEAAAARELLSAGGVRLVTFTGPGGTGKTRLSLHLAAGLVDQFPNGVYFVSLAEVTDPNLVVSKIAQVLEVREGGNQPVLETVKDFLQDKRLLLVLDNFEHVITAAPRVTDLLTAAPALKVLVSSRSVLRLRGEHEFPVPPLELPDPAETSAPALLGQNESMQLFVERARAADPKFALTAENASAVADICRRLDGLPLAIELAAARAKLLPPQALLARLTNRLALLTGGAVDLPARQQTLRKTLDWSHSLLQEAEQVLFARLGVFVGGFSLDAVEVVCNLDGALDVLAGVEALLNNSLIRQEPGAGGQPRFRMLETIREYALDRLQQRGEVAATQRAFALYYIRKVAIEVGIRIYSEALAWLDWLDSEHANLREALAWGLNDAEAAPLIPPMVFTLSWFWYRRGYLAEGRMWSERLLASPVAARPTLARGYTLSSLASLALWQGDLRTARARGEETLTLAQQAEDEQGVPMALMGVGVVYLNMGQDAAAHALLKEAEALFREAGNAFFYPVTLVHLGNVALGLGKPAEARAWLDKAYAASRELNEPWTTSFVLNNFGEVARVQGDYDTARRYYEESESLLRRMGDKGDLARLICSLAYVAQHEGYDERAGVQFRESLAMFRKLGNKRGIAECLAGLAGLRAAQGQPQRAAQLLGAAEAMLATNGVAWWPADRAEVERTRAALQSGLGAATYGAEWAKGRDMPVDQALASAFDDHP